LAQDKHYENTSLLINKDPFCCCCYCRCVDVVYGGSVYLRNQNSYFMIIALKPGVCVID